MSDSLGTKLANEPETTTESKAEATKPEEPTDVQTGISLGMTAMVSFMTTLITAGIMLVAYDHFMAKKFLTVDVKGYIEQQQELYLAGKINDDQLKQSYVALKAAVEKIPRNRIVLMGDAVLGGAEKLDISSTPSK